MSRDVVLLVPDFEAGGGVPTVALFLREAMLRSGRYRPRVVSIPSWSRHPLSVRLTSPAGWLKGARVDRRHWGGVEHDVVGGRWVELEFQRYRARRELDRVLAGADLVQVVAGSAAWACAALQAGVPTLLQVATRIKVERRMQARADRGVRRAWRGAMTGVIERMEDYAFQRVDGVFVENLWMRDDVARGFPGQRVILAPPGVDHTVFHPGPGAGPGYILSVGRFDDPRKDVRLLLDAYDRLCRAMPGAPELVLVGRAPGAADLAYLATLPIAGRVRVVTDVALDVLAEWYRGATLFVLSSEEEGFGMVILEAMASGVPVVATDCGGPAVTVIPGETGWRTPVGDAPALAEAMERVLADPAEARRMGEAARAKVERDFTLEVAGDRFLAVYDELLDGAPRTAAHRGGAGGAAAT